VKRLAFSLILTLLGICEAYSQYDLRFEGFARSLPLGAYARVEAGYSFPLWKSKGPLYGFIRPYTQFQTSGLINSLHAGVEIFPVSFWGIYAGRTQMIRSLKKLDQVDCDRTDITCESNNIGRNRFGTKLALKFGSVFTLTRLQWHKTFIRDNENQFFFDEQGTLLGLGNEDTLFQAIQIIGMDFDNTHGVAALHKRNLMQKSGQDSSMSVLLYKRNFKSEFKNPYTLLIGPGVFHTRTNSDHLMLFALLQFSYEKGLTLF